jgi:hypothetical protein
MKRKVFLYLVLAVTCLSVSISLTIFGQQDANKSAGEDFSSLKLSLMTNKMDFLPYEPIPTVIVLKNETSSPIIGHSQLEFKGKFIRILVTRENGDSRVITNLSAESCKCERPEQVSILPGQSFQTSDIFFNLHNAFSTPGLFNIRAVLSNADRSEEITSEAVAVRIIEPEGSNLAAYDFLKSEMGQNNFLFSGIGKDETYKKLETTFNGSLYSDYARYFIGSRYLFKGNYEKAEPLLRLSVQLGDFVFIDEAKNRLSQVLTLKAKQGPN